jgi:predicted small secreted protein
MDKPGTFCEIFNPMKHLLAILLLAITTTALSACNTIKGVGQDVSAGGRDLTKAAGAVERKIQN